MPFHTQRDVSDFFFLVNLQVVVSNLVDSNVFLRAVILSLEFFSARRSELKVGWRQKKRKRALSSCGRQLAQYYAVLCSIMQLCCLLLAFVLRRSGVLHPRACSIHAYVYVCMYVCIYIYIYMYIYVYICVYMYTYVCTYIHTHIYVYVHICVCEVEDVITVFGPYCISTSLKLRPHKACQTRHMLMRPSDTCL